jgi:hypothetical protein
VYILKKLLCCWKQYIFYVPTFTARVSVPFCVQDERNCPRKKECEPGSKCHQQCVTLANGTDACSCHTGYTINSDGYRYVDATLLHVATPVATQIPLCGVQVCGPLWRNASLSSPHPILFCSCPMFKSAQKHNIAERRRMSCFYRVWYPLSSLINNTCVLNGWILSYNGKQWSKKVKLSLCLIH